MNPNQPQNGAMQYFPQWQEKIGRKLFPNGYVFMPEMQGSHDCIVTTVKTNFSFIDRLRILVSGNVTTNVKTTTENVVGNCMTAAISVVRPPWWLDRIERE
jgi:hypothetical protein